MVECCNDKNIDFKKKCELLNISRGSMYYKPKARKNDDAIINILRDIYYDHPYYGYRRMTIELRKKGYVINNKKVLRLLRIAGLSALYPTKKAVQKNSQHQIFPYLLRDLKVEYPNQAWQVDITYIKVRTGFLFLICLIDIFSRKIMGWKLSIFLDTQSCLEALSNALKHGVPEIINSDQGSQFTSSGWTNMLRQQNISISMDGKGRWADNVYIERLWRTIKYELVFLHSFDNFDQAYCAIASYIIFYNRDRPHQALNYHSPDYIFTHKVIPTKQELFAFFASQQPIARGGL